MQPENDIPAAIDYAGTGETRAGDAKRVDGHTGPPDQSEPKVLVELVVVDGHEGQKLHAIQSEVIYRILLRLAEKQIHAPQKGGRL